MLRRSIRLPRRAAILQHQQHACTPRAFSATTSRRGEIELEINGKSVKIEQGAALIQACDKAGVHIPRYCYHDKLQIAGNCRMCLVEVERSPKPQASCAMPAMPGMKVHTNTPLVHQAREGVMEFLLANHPLDCPVCDQGGECDLQDQSMRYGSDRSRFAERTGKRAVEDKNIGPLVKTIMTRCIHCTRCVRFANELAGAPELGTSGRGNSMQIGTYIETALKTEMSGNVIDLCPVGALTSKPYAFRARPWETKKTETIDVHDALGCNIRVDTRGVEVMRVMPRLNDDVNEEWINDKTRFANDGLKMQRLTHPLVKVGDKFEPCSWEQALVTIKDGFDKVQPKGDEIKAVAGHLVDAESMVALRDLVHSLGSENLALDQALGDAPIAHGVDIRSNYLFNSRLAGVEEADKVLIVGSNMRHEASVLNARLRKSWLRSDALEIALVGEQTENIFQSEHLGNDAAALKKALAGAFGRKLAAANRPMIILGSALAEHPDGKALFDMVAQFAAKHENVFFQQDAWNGFNVLQRAASRAAAYDTGFTAPSPATAKTQAKFVYLLGADEVDGKDIPKDAFVVYQGHHGDLGAQYADVVLPGAAYTEKSGTYVNTEGRTQTTRAATNPPGVAREDWKIVRALSEVLEAPLKYDDLISLRDRMAEIAPSLARYDVVEPSSLALVGLKSLAEQNKGSSISGAPLKNPVNLDNFYLTDAIARSSKTMARCYTQFSQGGSADKQQEVAYGQ
ncbi:NADH-ubiquinone oxidoreductase, subunit G [Protomyces lactucae-debilis]|uniref:NADH-ubiquinone oxidoreductase 78 kDa subunit, mitochondrial n=1 Tax=Protomyces lactucae-debilis TaxID=2754530 RepID=A0A1Y2EU24_PROLT|nr:NADH-ubiquinone oxidoreductase, subunit G [Protomyces lactucae-debilis]ORY74345.1 NADH-ubiquinone oxidoreductase, subunit G [Protomyces lactucae-debilis]